MTIRARRAACLLLPSLVLGAAHCSRRPKSSSGECVDELPRPPVLHDDLQCSHPLVHDGDSVFLVGNSFLDYGGRRVQDWLVSLGKQLSPPVNLSVGADIVYGNTPLSEFLNHSAVQQALASRQYKVFVLQGEDLEPVDHKSDFHQAVRSFHRAISAAGAKTVLFMTWDFPSRPVLKELADSYEEIGRELGIPIVPVGLIYQDCRQTHPKRHGRYWLTASPDNPEGDLHENAMGSAVNTYALFEMLTGLNPHGRNFPAPGNTNSDSLMHSLSDMAWSWVAPRLEGAPAAGAGAYSGVCVSGG